MSEFDKETLDMEHKKEETKKEEPKKEKTIPTSTKEEAEEFLSGGIEGLPIFGSAPEKIKMERGNKKFNTLFGAFEKDGDTWTLNGNMHETDMEDYISRKYNISRKMQNAKKLLEIRKNPSKYMENKNKQLDKIASATAGMFSGIVVKYLKYGFSQKEAVARAEKDIKGIEQLMMNAHEAKFPYTVEQVMKMAR